MIRPKTRRIADVVLVASLVLSIGANVYLVRSSRHYIQAAAAVRLDPAGFKTYSADRANPPGARPLVVLFGDSRALMWSEPAVAEYRFLNRGIGFQTTAQMLLRLEEDVLQLRPQVVVVEGGVNDLKEIANFPERRAEIVADCEANLARIVEQCRRVGSTVVMVTVFGIGDVPLWRRPFWSDEVDAAVREVNAFLPKLAAERVVLFDAGPVLADARHPIQPAYQLDYLHLSSNGYASLNRGLAALLQGLPK
jgi:lysophospholipase L1-like esterase